MRSVPLLVALAACAVLAACREAGPSGFPAAPAGHLVALRRGGARLLDVPARATYCAGDSLLFVIALGEDWSAGLAIRGRMPLAAARTFTVRPVVAGDGTASAAFRSVGDSVEPALMASRGTVRLEAGAPATGRFELVAPPAPGTSVLRYVIGAFRAVPVADSAATCGILPRTP